MMNTSPFMDKQIMNLSSQSHNDFIDLMNFHQDDTHISGGDVIFPSYDFQPIRPASSSSPSTFDSSTVVGGLRASSSADNKSSPPTIRNYTSHVSFEPTKGIPKKDGNTVDTTLLSEIDRTMKKYADNILHALDGVSARLSQLESRTRHLENSVDDLSVSVVNNHGKADGRIRQLEHILREVQNGVHDIKDKQEIMDAHLQLAKLQVSEVEQHAATQSLEPLESAHSTAQQSQQQLSSSGVQPPPAHILPSQQNVLNMGQLPNHFLQNQIPSLPQQEQYLPPLVQAPENLGQPFQVPPQQLQAPAPSTPPQQYPPPQSQYFQPPASPQQSIISNANLPQQTPTSGHHSVEQPYMQSQSYPSNIHQPPSHPPSSAPQYYRPPPPSMYEPPSNRPSPGFSGSSPVSSESYPYNNSSQYKKSSSMKPHQLSSHAMSRHDGGGSYPQPPAARTLPHALPTASGVSNAGSGSASSGNKFPIDDVIDKVTIMGFPRDLVRATVRKLTDNGQAVDLNVVLDKLMNDGDGQTRAWFNR